MSATGSAECVAAPSSTPVAAADDAARRRPRRDGRLVFWMPWAVAAVVVIAFAPVWNCEFVNWDDDRNLVNNLQYRGLSPGASALDVHHLSLRPLPALELGHAGHRLHALGHAAARLSCDQPGLAHGQRPAGVCVGTGALAAGGTRRGRHRHRSHVASACRAPPRSRRCVSPSIPCASSRWRGSPSGATSCPASSCCSRVLAYLRMVDARPAGAWRTWLALSLGCFVLSLLSKAWGMTLPVVLLVLDVYPLQRFASGRDTAAAHPAREAAVPGAGVRRHGVGRTRRSSPGRDAHAGATRRSGARVMQAAYGLMFYLWKTVLPLNLSPLYPLRPDFDPTAPAVPALCGRRWWRSRWLLMRVRRRWPWALAAWSCVCRSSSRRFSVSRRAARSSSPIATPTSPACPGRCWPAPRSTGCRAAVARRPPSMIAAGLVTLSALTFRQTRVWTNGFTLWDHALRIDPSNYVADVNRGWLQLQRDDLDGALAYYEAALRANPRFAIAYREPRGSCVISGEICGERSPITPRRWRSIRPRTPISTAGWRGRRWATTTARIADYTVALQAEAPNARARSNRGFLRLKRGDLPRCDRRLHPVTGD